MITVPTREVILAEFLAALKAARPNIDTSKGSPEWARANALVELTYGIHWNVREVQYTIWPGPNTPTAELELHADLRLGPNARLPAVAASVIDGVQVTGTLAGAAVSAGDTLAHSDGTRYEITEDVTVGAGTADVSVQAITKGIIGNKLTGDVLTFESPPSNIEAAASIVQDLDGGADQETDASLLERVQHAYLNPPAGGRFSDYWGWARGVAGVSSAYCYGPSSYNLNGRRGLGIVDVAVLGPGTGSERQPSAELVQLVQDKLDAERPVHAKPGLALRPSPVDQAIDVKVTPREGYEFDWTGSDTVSSYSSKVITLTTGPVPDGIIALVDAGSTARIMLKGQLMVVTAYANPGGGPYTITVQDTPSPVPVATDPIYPGGPLTAPALAAIKAYMDSLGPVRPSYADPNQNWDDTCRPDQISAVLLERRLSDGSTVGVAGLKGTDVITPSSDVTPSDDVGVGGQPEFLYYDEVTVRPV
jgi:hypothetical protein